MIDDALHETTTLLVQLTADLDAHRTTAQDATATRLRVEELRREACETHRTMSTLPRPSTGDVGLVAFQQADAEVERRDAQLRRAKAIDVSMRVGVDQFLDGSSAASPYFAVLAVDLNLGLLFQGSGNRRAAEGRLRYLRSGRDPLSGDATADRLRVLLDTSIRRDQETAALEADLARDLENLDKSSGEESRRYRQVVWFEWIKVRAERAFHQAHAAALKRALGSV